jgi:hypothetical protein
MRNGCTFLSAEFFDGKTCLACSKPDIIARKAIFAFKGRWNPGTGEEDVFKAKCLVDGDPDECEDGKEMDFNETWHRLGGHLVRGY